MTKLIVFTDLHMLPEGGRIIGLDPYERLQNGVRHVNRHHPDAARVICTGDLTHKGDAVSYARLREVLSELKMPYSLLLGNHDARDTFRTGFADIPVDEAGYVQSMIDLPEGRLLLLDTLIEPPHDFPYASGYLCVDRLNWLDRQLTEAAGRPCYLFMHHPPHDVGFPGMDEIKLVNDTAFYELLHRHGNVRHIFAGHIHRTIGGSWRGIPFSIFKSPVHQQPMILNIADSSLSVAEPAAYGIILLRADGALVHTEDYEISDVEAGTDEATAPAAMAG
ncbi:MAG TPA: phosphodiesterase [Terriglobia bacterium]|nr:phosphodiesterase [Terriglobia bacterium]